MDDLLPIDDKEPVSLSIYELVGVDLANSSGDFTSSSRYIGTTLAKVGITTWVKNLEAKGLIKFKGEDKTMNKYELTEESIDYDGRKLFRIKALVNFGNVSKGELGGFIESKDNLSNLNGNAWVHENAMVYDGARVYGDAKIYGYAKIYENAKVCGDARVRDIAKIYGNARIYGNAEIRGEARIYDEAFVYGNVCIYGNARIYGNAWVYGNSEVNDDAEIYGYAKISGNAKIVDAHASIYSSDHALQIGAIGSRCDVTNFFRTTYGKIWVICGCFSGDIDEFAKRVKETHEGTKHETTYNLAIQLAKAQIELD